MPNCPTLTPGSAFLSGVLDFVDCQAQTLGAGGYQALAAPGSVVSVALTAVLTVFVALFGYRLLFGEALGIRDATLALVKIGVVLVLATSWPAYRVLAYDVALRGPAELVAAASNGAGLPGADGNLVAHLQSVDDALIELNVLGAGPPEGDAATDVSIFSNELSPPQEQKQQTQRRRQPRQRWDPARDALLLGQARAVYLTGAITALASVRLVAGLLLALAPFFALFLLFDGTRGLFEGWVRSLVGAALGAVSSAVLLGVELALFEPWLAAILTERRANVSTPSVPVELSVATWIFALTLLTALLASALVARGFHIPNRVAQLPQRWLETFSVQGERGRREDGQASDPYTTDRTRALAIADAATSIERRERTDTHGQRIHLTEHIKPVSAPVGRPIVSSIVPLGQTGRRRTASRVSAERNRRDAK